MFDNTVDGRPRNFFIVRVEFIALEKLLLNLGGKKEFCKNT